MRLARELRDSDRLGADAIERTIEALRDFLAVAKGAGATRMIAVATSAVRDAADGAELVERAQRLGVPLQTIDGDHEALLGFYGAVHDLPVTGGVTMDVGGGSVELTSVPRAGDCSRSWSMPLGSLRVSDRFLDSDPPDRPRDQGPRQGLGERPSTDAGIAELGARRGTRGHRRHRPEPGEDRPEAHRLPVAAAARLPPPREAARALIEELAGRSMKRRASMPGLNPDRADTIVGGALVIHGDHAPRGRRPRSWCPAADSARDSRSPPTPATIPSAGVGAQRSRWRRWPRGSRPGIPAAAERRARLADDLHEALDPAAPPRVREMLGHAATLLDVGRAIDYYDRFEHAAMIVTAADLGGFSHADLGALTAILRQADDDTRLGPYGRLVDNDDRAAVLRAATALTLADELNRRIPPDVPAPISLQLDARRVRGRRAGPSGLAPARGRAAVREGVRPAPAGRGQRDPSTTLAPAPDHG